MEIKSDIIENNIVSNSIPKVKRIKKQEKKNIELVELVELVEVEEDILGKPVINNTIKRYLKIMLRFHKYCHNIYSKLTVVFYNKTLINYYSINSFNISSRTDNDKNNKIRESIIGSIINNQIPKDYYKYSLRWKKMKDEIDKYILDLCILHKLTNNSQKCVNTAGRKNNYDLLLIINESNQFNIEIKFNAQNVDETPQFVSPMKPSQYLESSYEEYYYDNYLTILSNEFNLSLPNKQVFLNKIHSNKPKCMIEFQSRYYKGCKISSKYTGMEEDIKFYNRSKELSENSIKTFIENNALKIDELTNYLLNTQTNKTYMLYKNGKIYLQYINSENYQITSYKKEPHLQRYVATTKTGIVLKILLRWKNGNGIAYPAFQIS